MATYYIDSNASGANDGTSKTDAAESLGYLVNTVGGVSGENTFYFAHDHVAGYTANTDITLPGGQQDLISIDFSDDSYTPGADESVGNGSRYYFSGTADAVSKIHVAGIIINPEDEFRLEGNGTRYYFKDCDPVGCEHNFIIRNDGVEAFFDNCDINYGGGGFRSIRAENGALAHFFNCRAEAGITAGDNLFAPGGNGGGRIICENMDLTGFIGSGDNLVQVSSSTEDYCEVTFKRCKLPASWNYVYTGESNFRFDISECDDADEYAYFFYLNSVYGQAEIDLTQYVDDGSVTYDGTNEFSVQIDTDSDATPYAPFKYKLATIPGVDLTTAQSVNVQLSGGSGLTDKDVWLEIEIQDATDQALGIIQSTQASDPEGSGTALSAGTATWANTTPTEYEIEHDIGAQTGVTNSNVTVYICVGKASEAALNVSMPTIADT